MKIKNKDILIVGGGFRGIVLSEILNRSNSVELIESSKFIGGVLFSEEWHKFYIDKGIHIFANIDNQYTKFIQKILKNKFYTPKVIGGSRIIDFTSKDVSVPDFTTLNEKKQKKIWQELIYCSFQIKKSKNLHDFIINNYGKTAGKYYIRLAKKRYGIDPKKLSPDSKNFGPISRGRFFNDQITELLKQSEIFDKKLALPSFNDPLKWYQGVTEKKYRYFYPTKKGLRQFCDDAKEYLEKNNVSIKTNIKIENISKVKGKLNCSFSDGTEKIYDKIIWTIDPLKIFKIIKSNKSFSDSGIHSVPMIIYYFIVNIKNINEFTYIHDFTCDVIPYRAAVSGLLGKQIIKNHTYIDVEIPTKIGSKLWNEPERYYEKVWNDVVKMGLVKGHMPKKKKFIKTPISFRAIKINYDVQNKKILENIKKFSPNIILIEQENMQMLQIMNSLRKQFLKC